MFEGSWFTPGPFLFWEAPGQTLYRRAVSGLARGCAFAMPVGALRTCVLRRWRLRRGALLIVPSSVRLDLITGRWRNPLSELLKIG